MVVGHVLMVHMYSFQCSCHIGMTIHTPAFLQVGDHSRNLLYAHTTSLSTSGSGTQQGQGMVMGYTNLATAPYQDCHPYKY